MGQGNWFFAVDQNAFLQGYLPNVLMLVRAITGGNELVFDTNLTESVSPPRTIHAGPTFITTATPDYAYRAACSAAMTGTGYGPLGRTRD